MFVKKRFSIRVLAVFCLSFALGAMAEAPLDAPVYPIKPTESQIYDDNHLLNASETRLFDDLADKLYKKTGIELTCVIVDDIGHANQFEKGDKYAQNTADAWQLGKESGEGVMIFVSQKQRWKNIVVTPGAEKYYLTPEAVAAAENSNITFGEDPVPAQSAPEPAAAPAPESAEEPAPKAKDKKQLKEEKRKKKLDKQKKVRRNDHLSGNDIDMYPEDGES